MHETIRTNHTLATKLELNVFQLDARDNQEVQEAYENYKLRGSVKNNQ